MDTLLPFLVWGSETDHHRMLNYCNNLPPGFSYPHGIIQAVNVYDSTIVTNMWIQLDTMGEWGGKTVAVQTFMKKVAQQKIVQYVFKPKLSACFKLYHTQISTHIK